MGVNEKYNLALQHFNSGDINSSMQICSEIIDSNPTHHQTYLLLATMFYNLKDFVTAQNFLNVAISHKKDFYDAYFLLGNIYSSSSMYNEAIDIWNEALKYTKKKSFTLSNISSAHLSLENYDEAIRYAELAYKDDKKNAHALQCLYKIYQKKEDVKNIQKYLTLAIKLSPNDPNINFDYSYLLFKQQKFKEAFKHYEYRKNVEDRKNQYNFLPFTEYKKGDIKDKSLVIYYEQGYGDNIQFARFLNHLPKGLKKVTMGIQNPLRKLFEYNFKNIDFVPEIKSNDNYDYSLAFMSIPYRFALKDISSSKFLNVDNSDIERFKNNIDKNFRKKIGIVFRGSEFNKTTLELDSITNILNDDRFDFYSLQIEGNDEISSYNIKSLEKYLKDFYDTATAIMSMDYIITIDSAVAHLAGALGQKGTVIHNSNILDFRWETQNNQAIWYDSLNSYKLDQTNIENILLKELNEL